MRKSKGITLASDASCEWEIRSIVGQKIIDHEVYYRVNWEPTWIPESALDTARPLIDKFLTQLYKPLDGWNRYREGGCSKRGYWCIEQGRAKTPRETSEEIRARHVGA
jgi:hypothetical protein